MALPDARRGPAGLSKAHSHTEAHNLLASTQVAATLRTATRVPESTEGPNREDSSKESYHPWEDVFLGYALARVATGSALATVHVGSEVFYEETPSRYSAAVTAKPSLQVWHDSSKLTKRAARIGAVNRFAREHHCSSPFEVRDSHNYQGCSPRRDVWRRLELRYTDAACVGAGGERLEVAGKGAVQEAVAALATANIARGIAVA